MAASLSYSEAEAASEGEGTDTSDQLSIISTCTNDSSSELIHDLIMRVAKWMKRGASSKRDESTLEHHAEFHEYWRTLTEVFRGPYERVREFIPELMIMIDRTVNKWYIWYHLQRDVPKRKDEIDHIHVALACLECLTVVVTAMTNEFESVGFDPEFFGKFQSIWPILYTNLYAFIHLLDSTIACTMLDVVAATGNDLYGHLPETNQKGVLATLLGLGSDKQVSPNVRAKIGRCLAKFVEFPLLRDHHSFFLDVFDLTAESIANGESVVKVSFAWTFGNLTDVLVEANVMVNRILTQTPGFMNMVVETAVKCIEVPARARYSSCRAWGNIFRWLQEGMLYKPEHHKMMGDVVINLESMVGKGLDYKLRWNAAHALGHALGNNPFVLKLHPTTISNVIKSLAKWAAQSQNYKERTQCVIALSKAKAREIFANDYSYVWDRVCLSLTRLPVDECDSADKYKIECVLLIIHLISILEFDDLFALEPTLAESMEMLKTLFAEYVPLIPLSRLDVSLSCQENLHALMELTKTKLSGPDRRRGIMRLIEVTEVLYRDD